MTFIFYSVRHKSLSVAQIMHFPREYCKISHFCVLEFYQAASLMHHFRKWKAWFFFGSVLGWSHSPCSARVTLLLTHRSLNLSSPQPIHWQHVQILTKEPGR